MTTPAPATFCANHPTVETSLRCNRCEKYICPRCAIKTPTGYRCPECVRALQQGFDTAEWYDYLTGTAVAAGLSLLASLILLLLSFFVGFFMWLITAGLAPTAAVAIAEVCRRVLRKRRSRQLFTLVAAGVVAGALPAALFLLLSGMFFNLIYLGIYLVIAVPTVYTRLSGIRLS